jgi:hypothetical protein
MYKVRVYDIYWDFDRGQTKKPQAGKSLTQKGLHPEYVFEFDDSVSHDEHAENICDEVSDHTGYCIFGCKFEILKG